MGNCEKCGGATSLHMDKVIMTFGILGGKEDATETCGHCGWQVVTYTMPNGQVCPMSGYVHEEALARLTLYGVGAVFLLTAGAACALALFG